MATKAEELATEGCLHKAADDEPVFVLRAQDAAAPYAVLAWASHAEDLGSPPEKVGEARRLARSMLAWQQEHGMKVPD